MSPDEQSSPAPPAASRRAGQWIGKAVFEAVLIVLGLVGALLIDEWRDDRERRARLDTAMASIRAELLENRKIVAARLESNERLIAELRQLAEKKAYYNGGIIRPGEPLSSVAWEAARSADVGVDIPFERLVVLGRAYTALMSHQAEMQNFSDSFLQVPGLVERFRADPRSLAGFYNDVTRRVRTLLERLDAALALIPQSAS
jgi:hypothetical protein